MKRIIGWIALAALGLTAVWGWLRMRTNPESETPMREIAVERGSIRQTVVATGTVEPRNRVELGSPIAGRVEDVLVREGDTVSRGQVLAWVSSTERATLLDAARARGPEELARWQSLFNPTPVIAPLDGSIIARLLEPGQNSAPDKPILVLADRLLIRAQVDETDLARVAPGIRAEVRLDAYPDHAFTGRVEHISYESRVVNNVTFYNAEIVSDELPEFVRSGMSAAITFILQETNSVLTLPLEAIRRTGDRTMVWLPADTPRGAPREREILTGLDDGRRVEIRSGLAEGDRVLAPDLRLSPAGAQKTSPFLPFGGRRRL